MLKTIEFAIKAHDGQIRRYSKEPFVCHPIRVANILGAWGYSGDFTKAAILHDVVEDTHVTQDDIEREFNGRVAGLVKELTNYGDTWKERKENAVRHMREEMGIEALVIKLADRMDNILSTITEVEDTGKWPFKKVSKDMHIWYAEQAARVALERLGPEHPATLAVQGSVRQFIILVRWLESKERGDE